MEVIKTIFLAAALYTSFGVVNKQISILAKTTANLAETNQKLLDFGYASIVLWCVFYYLS